MDFGDFLGVFAVTFAVVGLLVLYFYAKGA
jgi:hypothetical protein